MQSERPRNGAEMQQLIRKLGEAGRFSRQIIDSVHEGIVVSGPDMCCLVWNPYMERLSGMPASEVLGKRAAELFPFLHEGGVAQAIRRVLEGGEPISLAFPFEVSSTGRSGWVSDTTAPLRNAEGEIVGAISIVRDITEQKKLEDTQQFLSQCGWSAAGEDFFAALARHLGESLKVDYVCIDRLVGEGRSAQTVAVYYDGHFEDNIEYALQDTPCGEVVGQVVCCFPHRVRQLFPKDQVLQEMGAEGYVGTTLWSSSGEPIGLIAMISRKPLEDHHLAEAVLKLVTVRAAGELERREAEQALLEARSSLEQRVEERTRELSKSNELLRQEIAERKLLEERLIESKRLESIGQLAGGVAHEVRNPLNAIVSITEALFQEKEIAANPEFEPYMQHMRVQVNRLVHLMKDLLDLGKPINPSHLIPLSLLELCSDALSLWESSGTAENKSVLFRCASGSDSLRVMADGIKLQQVLFNLLENAGHHTPLGSEIFFDVSMATDDETSLPVAVIRVTDRGRGVPEEMLPRVFEPFFSDRKGGTGLGLALVRHFVESMGGSVSLWNNDPPPGCSAEVCIPLYGEEAP